MVFSKEADNPLGRGEEMATKDLRRRLLGAFLIFGLLAILAGLAGAMATIKLVSPRPGATLRGSVLIQAAVEAPEVAYVIFAVDGERPHATNSRPYTFLLDTTELSDGTHTIFAEAYSHSGLLGRSAAIRVKVKNAGAAPAPAATPRPRTAQEPAIEARLTEKPLPQPGLSALTSRVPGQMPRSEGQLQAMSAEPRVASESVSLPSVKELPPAAAVVERPRPAAAPPAPAEVKAPTITPDGKLVVVVNGEVVTFERAPQIRDGSLEAGFRKILSSAGWEVDWVGARRTGVAFAQGRRLEVTLGEEIARIDGRHFSLGQKVKMINDRLVVAVRPLCQAAQIRLEWDQKTRTAKLSSPSYRQSVKTLAAVR